nr:hypothetical protein CFP56_72355 [Quercus suber]
MMREKAVRGEGRPRIIGDCCGSYVGLCGRLGGNGGPEEGDWHESTRLLDIWGVWKGDGEGFLVVDGLICAGGANQRHEKIQKNLVGSNRPISDESDDVSGVRVRCPRIRPAIRHHHHQPGRWTRVFDRSDSCVVRGKTRDPCCVMVILVPWRWVAVREQTRPQRAVCCRLARDLQRMSGSRCRDFRSLEDH